MAAESHRRGVLIPLAIAVVATAVTVTMGLAPLSDGDGSASPGPGATSPSASSTPTSPSAPVKVNPTPERTAKDKNNPLRKLERRKPGDPMAMGRVDAPVVIINFSDFQCPYCGKFARETHPVLVEKFVNKGILRIEWRDFPYLGEESFTAANAARAAAMQDKFWQFHDYLYGHQPSVNSGKWDVEYFTDLAADMGLDVQKFRQDMQSDKVAERVQRDFLEGQALGVTGTPAFLVNGKPMIGAQPTKVFVDAVKRAADEAR